MPTTEAPPSDGVTRRALASGDGTAPATAPTEVCTPPLPLDDLAMVFGPAEAEDRKPNDPDLCGYYLMPYDLLDTLSVRFGGMFATQVSRRRDV